MALEAQPDLSPRPAPLKRVSPSITVVPFGEVHYADLLEENARPVRATIATDFVQEGTRYAIALDGSRSAQRLIWPGWLPFAFVIANAAGKVALGAKI